MANEKRLIDANAFFDRLKKLAELMRQGEIGEIDLNLLIASTPTVDAVEVVRCKDCKHYMEYPLNKVDKRMCCYVHLLTPHFTPEDGFCSYGERKENG